MRGRRPSEKRRRRMGQQQLACSSFLHAGLAQISRIFFLSRRKKREREGWCEKEEEERRDGAEVMRIKGIFSSLFPSFLSLE